MKFAGNTSSEFAKERYVPVCHFSGEEYRNQTLGLNTSAYFCTDPKQLGFIAAKHKFVGKMLLGFEHVLEIGCMDGFGSAIVASFVKQLTSIDFFQEHIDQAKRHMGDLLRNVTFQAYDFLDEPVPNRYDGCFALDVLEHIDPAQEDLFLRNVVSTLTEHGVFVCGMPSLESQAYASEPNKFAHINCQSADRLSATLKRYFYHVFSFGMNDEVLHTGYGKMCHYLINVCAGPKK